MELLGVSFISYYLFTLCSHDGLRSIFWSRSNLVKSGSVRGEPVHAVIVNIFFFGPIMVRFYEITRGTGSVRQEPVQYGEPVRAVMVQLYNSKLGGVGVVKRCCRAWRKLKVMG